MKKIIPHFFVEDVQTNINFYKNILGFKTDYFQPESGKANFAIMSNGTVEIMFGTRGSITKYLPEYEDKTLSSSVIIYIEMKDVETFYEEICEDVTVVKKIQDTWYNTKEFWIKDCNGYIVAFFENI